MSFDCQTIHASLFKLKKPGIVVSGLASIALSVPASAGQVQPHTRYVNCKTQAECQQIESEVDRLLAQSGGRHADLNQLMRAVQQLSGKPSGQQDAAPPGVNSPLPGQSTKDDAAPGDLENKARALMQAQSERGPSSQALAAMATAIPRPTVTDVPLAAARKALEQAEQ